MVILPSERNSNLIGNSYEKIVKLSNIFDSYEKIVELWKIANSYRKIVENCEMWTEMIIDFI
jgi:hypothetical protein